MSASPDDTDWLSKLLANPNMGLAIGLMQAGGYSPHPVGLGQAFAEGMQGAQQFQQNNLDTTLKRLQLGQKVQGLNAMQDYFNGDQGTNDHADNLVENGGAEEVQPSAPSSPGLAAAMSPPPPVSSDLQGAPEGMAATLQPPPPKGMAAAMTAPKPSAALPTAVDPTRDPQYLKLVHQSAALGAFNPEMSKAAMDQANARLAYLKDQSVTLNPDQAKLIIPGGLEAGYSIQYHPSTGAWEEKGNSPYHNVSGFDPQSGIYRQDVVDMRSGKSASNLAGAPPDVTKPLAPVMEKMAQGMSTYDFAPPVVSAKNPGAQILLDRAHEINPDYKAQNYATSLKAVKDFGTGKQGDSVRSFNAALRHLDTLDDAASALDNGNIPLFNSISNTLKTQLGGAAPTSFDAVKQIVGKEIVKSIVPGAGGEQERKDVENTLKNASSPAQLRGVIDHYKQLMVGQLESLKQQYEASTFRKDFYTKFLSKEALKVMTDAGISTTSSGTLVYDPGTGKFK